ncbi:hypothetical protein QW060_05525 [Myroides ceti]|uniref:Uncharacterized protein n=1 Tax=Paenimyroides ceti TaxID=395087 RepID=A0ABT8CQ11_9FLAO|nr:hypothetical protein [Paenimyroides ceti]MDN3706588.1 hypothetical protein [Paenimyroides ceti]
MLCTYYYTIPYNYYCTVDGRRSLRLHHIISEPNLSQKAERMD